MRTEQWYQAKLARYFNENYGDFEDVAEWHNNPDFNKWVFDIPEQGVRVELTCRGDGKVVEDIHELGVDVEPLYKLVKENCQGFDAIYEDYIIDLVGEQGFLALRAKKLLCLCGSVNGRSLYTLS